MAEQHRCLRDLPGIERVSVLLPYEKLTRSLIHALKYHGAKSLGEPLGAMMAERMLKEAAFADGTLVVPVPLHPDKRGERGYNQCELLARGFAAACGLEVASGLVERTRNTDTQTALDPESRKSNVQGAFRFTGAAGPESCRAVLVDDVLTTGSTILECAGALRDGGFSSISVCVVATPAMHDS